MNKHLYIILLIFVISIVFIGSASAVFLPQPEKVGDPEPLKQPDIMGDEGLVNRITSWLFTILLLAAVVFIILSGYMFVTSAGDPETIKKARTFLLYAVIALVVAISAKAIVNFIHTQFGDGAPEVVPGGGIQPPPDYKDYFPDIDIDISDKGDIDIDVGDIDIP